jgi:hypothetical protein
LGQKRSPNDVRSDGTFPGSSRRGCNSPSGAIVARLYALDGRGYQGRPAAGSAVRRAGVERRVGQLMREQAETVGLASGREGKRKSLEIPETPSDKPTMCAFRVPSLRRAPSVAR